MSKALNLKGCLETVRGYGRKLHEAESRYAEAANRAGRRVYRADRLNAAARKLAGVVDHAVKFGN